MKVNSFNTLVVLGSALPSFPCENFLDVPVERVTGCVDTQIRYRAAQLMRLHGIIKQMTFADDHVAHVHYEIDIDMYEHKIVACKTSSTDEGVVEALHARLDRSLQTDSPLRIAVLTNYYAHKKTRDALTRAGLPREIQVLCAEDVLAKFAPLPEDWVRRIMDFYRELGMSDKGRNRLHQRLRTIQHATHKN